MNEITVVFEPTTDESIAAGLVEHAATEAALVAKQVARTALLTKLGITADEAQLLLGGM